MSDEENKDLQSSSENSKDVGDDWAEAMAEQKQSESSSDGDTGVSASDTDWAEAMAEQQKVTSSAPEVAQMDSFDDDLFGKNDISDSPDLQLILDIPVNISMEVGSTSISIRNLLHLNQGSVIELDRFAGEPLDVLVNGTLVAHGEVVVINEKFGIRLTDVMSAAERVQKFSKSVNSY